MLLHPQYYGTQPRRDVESLPIAKLDWWKKFRDETLPVFNDLYKEVAEGREAGRSIASNSKPDYREKLEVELKELADSEMWQAGKTVRSLRPENQPAAGEDAIKKSSKVEAAAN